jgi:hypothetical protein
MFQSLLQTWTTQPQQMIQEWNQAARQQLSRLETLSDEVEKTQAETVARATENADRVLELTRQLQVEASTRTGEALDLFTKLGKQIWGQGAEVLDQAAELGKAAQADSMTRVGEAVDQASKLGRELRSHGAEPPKQWRKLWIDMARRGLDTSGASS